MKERGKGRGGREEESMEGRVRKRKEGRKYGRKREKIERGESEAIQEMGIARGGG